MKYSFRKDSKLSRIVLKTQGFMSLEIRDTENYSILDFLDKMQSRGHLSYTIFYQGEPLNRLQWEHLLEDEELRIDQLEIEADSKLDPITLQGFGRVVATSRKSFFSKDNKESKYKRPTSKKETINSWFYQNATECNV